jgi:hypothetical protein
MYIYLLRICDSSIGIGKATRHHEFNNDEIGFCLLFSSRNRLSWADCISTAIKYAILYLHIILLVLPDTFYLDESGSGTGSSLFSEVGSGSGPNRSGSATLSAIQNYRNKFLLPYCISVRNVIFNTVPGIPVHFMHAFPRGQLRITVGTNSSNCARCVYQYVRKMLDRS